MTFHFLAFSGGESTLMLFNSLLHLLRGKNEVGPMSLIDQLIKCKTILTMSMEFDCVPTILWFFSKRMKMNSSTYVTKRYPNT